MAGRVAIFQLLPFSHEENAKVSLLSVASRGVGPTWQASLWFRSYLQTYLERDVRAVSASGLADLSTFLGPAGHRHGQILNKTELAAPLGLSVPAVASG